MHPVIQWDDLWALLYYLPWERKSRDRKWGITRHLMKSSLIHTPWYSLSLSLSLSPVHPWIWTPSPLMHDSSLSLHIIQKKPIFTRHLKTRINQMEWQEKSRDLKALIISQFSSHTLSFLWFNWTTVLGSSRPILECVSSFTGHFKDR